MLIVLRGVRGEQQAAQTARHILRHLAEGAQLESGRFVFPSEQMTLTSSSSNSGYRLLSSKYTSLARSLNLFRGRVASFCLA